MSLIDDVTSKRLKLAVILCAPLLFVAACSSNNLTCADGNSNACRVSGVHRGDDVTGSIQSRHTTSRHGIATARPPVVRPVHVQYATRVRHSNTGRVRRHIASHKRRHVARRRRVTGCADVTGSITPLSRYPVATARAPMLSRESRLNTRPIEHVVAPGETLYSIARYYRVSVSDLASYNVIRNATLIKAGTLIFVPPS